MCSERRNISLAVGTRIKNFRTERKMSQKMRGEKCPTISTVYKICDKLKISLSQLLDFDMEIKPTNEEAAFYAIVPKLVRYRFGSLRQHMVGKPENVFIQRNIFYNSTTIHAANNQTSL